MSTTIEIAGRRLGAGHPALVIAEVGQNHDGSLGQAMAYATAAAECGADAIKFQTHIASEESTLDEPFRVRFSHQDETRFDYWRRMEFTPEQWGVLAEHCRKLGILFLSSAFSEAAVELLAGVGMPAWKVGSGEVFNEELMQAFARHPAPVLLSSGMSRMDEVDSQVQALRDLGLEVAVVQCTSRYPISMSEVGINVMQDYAARFGCPVGLSDHSGTMFPSLRALAAGASIIEVHITFDKRMFGPDVPASVTMEDLKIICQARDAFYAMDTNPVDKDALCGQLGSMRALFSKSLSPRVPLAKGTVLERGHLSLKKPGSGIHADELDRVLGRRLCRDVTPERLLRWEDME